MMMPTSEVLADLAPSGRMRVAINFGNPILANRHPVTQEPLGISVDLARRLADVLGVPLDFILYDAAGKVVEGLSECAWDVAFVARDPVRGKGIEQTSPYILIEGAYLVRGDSPIHDNSEVDQTEHTVVVGQGSAYDLYLTRSLLNATIVRSPTSPSVVAMMVDGGYDIAAGVRQQLEADANQLSGLRLLEGRFMVIEQAMGTPKGRLHGAAFLSAFVVRMVENEFVAHAIRNHGIIGAKVAS